MITHYVRSTSNCAAKNKCWRQERARRRSHIVNCCAGRDAIAVVPDVVLLLLVCGAKLGGIAAPPCRLVPVAAVVAVTLLPPALGATTGASTLAASALPVLESTARAVLLLLLQLESHSKAQVDTQQ